MIPETATLLMYKDEKLCKRHFYVREVNTIITAITLDWHVYTGIGGLRPWATTLRGKWNKPTTWGPSGVGGQEQPSTL